MRRATQNRHPARYAPVTPQIIQGTWGNRAFPSEGALAANCQHLANSFRNARYRARKQALARLFDVVETRTHLLHNLCSRKHAIVPLLIHIGSLRDRWIRDPHSWQPTPSTTGRHISQLIAHLFQAYDTPHYFKRSWWPNRGEPRDWQSFGWYVHVAGGGNIRNAPNMPTRLSRRAAHEMMFAPATSTAKEALRWGQMQSVGASDSLIQRVLWSQAALDFANDAVWLPLFAKLASEPTLPMSRVSPLVDYVAWAHQAANDNGDQFSLKGRSIASLLGAMERWHVGLGAELRTMRLLGAVTPGPRSMALNHCANSTRERSQRSLNCARSLPCSRKEATCTTASFRTCRHVNVAMSRYGHCVSHHRIERPIASPYVCDKVALSRREALRTRRFRTGQTSFSTNGHRSIGSQSRTST